MHAILIEVNTNAGNTEAARKSLQEGAAPMSRQAGATAGYWLDQSDGRAVAMVVFDSEASAKEMASNLKVGEQPPGAPEGVTFRTVEVLEVLATV